MTKSALNRTRDTLRLMHLQHKQEGKLPCATALTTIYLTLVEHMADASLWELYAPFAKQVFGDDAQQLLSNGQRSVTTIIGKALHANGF